MSQQNEYKKIYIQESDELLQLLNKNLLLLEKQPKNVNALNAIFRAAHTLKSMSASMGYGLIAELAHKMEDVLDQLRNHTIQVTDKVVDLLFKSFDSLEAMVESVQQDKEINIDTRPVLASLDKVMVKGPEIKEEEVEEGISLNVFEKKTLARVKKEGYSCYIINVTLAKTCVLKSVRAFMIFRNLHTIGEVIKSKPDSQSLEEEKFEQGFGCIFITKEKQAKVKKKVSEVLDVEKVKVDQMKIDKSWDEIKEKPSLEILQAQEAAPLAAGEHMRKIQSVRVDITRLDKLMNLVEELAISKLRLTEIGMKMPDPDLKAIIEGLSRLTDDLQTEVMSARLVPVSQIFDRFPRLVRDLAKKEQKKVRFDVIGGDIELDRTVLDEVGDPLIHLLRNAIDHGIEKSDVRKKIDKNEEARIMLTARREKSHVFIEVEDDGKGMDLNQIKDAALRRGVVNKEALESMTNEEVYLLTAHPGFSTKKEVTEVSGRGVGLDVVKQKTENLGGSIIIESVPEKGTKITMRLPITTAVVQALLVQILGKIFAIPISSVTEIVVVKESDINTIQGSETIMQRDRVLPIVRLDQLFRESKEKMSLRGAEGDEAISEDEIASGASHPRNDTDSSRLNVVIVEFGMKQFGIVVEKLLMQQDIVIKQMTKELKGIRGFAGATILGDGSVALVLDVATLI